jgi:hypothetical protein
MIPFEHTGPDRRFAGWIRNALLGVFMFLGAILLFPFTLLALFLRAMAYVANVLPSSSRPAEDYGGRVEAPA